jgi:hypothetical protein
MLMICEMLSGTFLSWSSIAGRFVLAAKIVENLEQTPVGAILPQINMAKKPIYGVVFFLLKFS